MRTLTLCCVAALLAAFVSQSALAQAKNSPFKAGVLLGLSTTQIDGDDQFGYDKKGFSGGLRGGVVLSRHWELCTELLYSERGSSPKSSNVPQGIQLNLQYAEVPLLLRYHYFPEEGRIFRFDLYTGFAYGRMVRSRTKAFIQYTQVDTFQNNPIVQRGYSRDDFSFIAGASWYVYQRLGITFRYNYSFVKFYKGVRTNDSYLFDERKQFEFFRSYGLTLGVFYEFNTPKLQQTKKKKKPKVAPQQ